MSKLFQTAARIIYYGLFIQEKKLLRAEGEIKFIFCRTIYGQIIKILFSALNGELRIFALTKQWAEIKYGHRKQPTVLLVK